VAGETRYGSAARDNPLKGKPWTWQRDETSPRRQVAEETVEDVRNVEDGTLTAGSGFPAEWWTPPADVAMRDEDPMGGALRLFGWVARFSQARRAACRPQDSAGGGELAGG